MAAIKVKTNPRLACATVRRIETADLLGALPDFETVVHISNRHIHLCREDLDALFGRGHELVKMKDLQQPGQYAAEETVEITGPKGTLQKIRVLGPLRPQTQVEISGTDQFALGSSAPVRESGDVAGTPGIRLTGPAGNADIKQGLIRALRHIHMTPKDAEAAGVENGEFVSVRIKGDRPAVLEGVLIRVSEKYSLEMHIDTDEANAVGMPAEAMGQIVVE
ncbi:MAG: phosphate propanoyltransferase [Spirochaetales bacterium]|nr:MAG: phosphate propanoyltransferase [Spirochaetales bacterium]